MYRVPPRRWFRARNFASSRGMWSTRAVHGEEKTDEDGGKKACAVHTPTLKDLKVKDFRFNVHDTNVYSSGQLKRTNWYDVNRDDNYGYQQWRSHTSPWRYWRHFGLLAHSSSLRRVLFPNMFAIGCISAGVGYYNSIIAPTMGSSLVSFPTMPLTLTGVGLSLLLVFRTKQSNARFDCARGCWGTVINSSLILLRLSSTYIAKRDERTYERIVRLLKSFSKTLHFHLSEDGDFAVKNDGNGVFTKDDALKRFLEQDGHSPDVVNAIMDESIRPLAVVEMISLEVASVNLDPRYEGEFQDSLKELDIALGMCERILKTPIPTSYTRHTSRFLALYTMMVPFALHSQCGDVGTCFASLFIAFGLYSIEDIGVTIEQPFAVLPTWRYVESVDKNCNSHLQRIRS